MNQMQLKEFNDKKIVYLFIPENNGNPGEVEYNFESGQARVTKDAGDPSPSYAHHAILAVERCVEKNNLPINYINAWY